MRSYFSAKSLVFIVSTSLQVFLLTDANANRLKDRRMPELTRYFQKVDAKRDSIMGGAGYPFDGSLENAKFGGRTQIYQDLVANHESEWIEEMPQHFSRILALYHPGCINPFDSQNTPLIALDKSFDQVRANSWQTIQDAFDQFQTLEGNGQYEQNLKHLEFYQGTATFLTTLKNTMNASVTKIQKTINDAKKLENQEFLSRVSKNVASSKTIDEAIGQIAILLLKATTEDEKAILIATQQILIEISKSANQNGDREFKNFLAQSNLNFVNRLNGLIYDLNPIISDAETRGEKALAAARNLATEIAQIQARMAALDVQVTTGINIMENYMENISNTVLTNFRIVNNRIHTAFHKWSNQHQYSDFFDFINRTNILAKYSMGAAYDPYKWQPSPMCLQSGF